ncbi:MAG: tRNA dihydrouridine synthase DusB [Desulfobulbaceae bacterium]|nr:tRNA dihydrouridine synthase DusB [Desulfobulbaceae bacterium]HIJ90757.1 tRNA dihydrouridine synthase DusB [Deltaproteobacteria bacterium]
MFSITTLGFDNPFILAPLAGYSDLAFRLQCREYGAALCFSEMISCHGLHFRQKNTLDLLRTVPAERPVAMQLFGSEPDIMGEAAEIISEYPIDLIDINMGCPARKVIKKGAGCALMKEPVLAAKIIRSVVKGASVPVTVKFRSGWNHQAITACDFAKMAEDNGAAAITIHARTWSDGFSGTADWGIIRQVKQAVSIPVIGNGDITSHADGVRMMEETGCDGVMIGRAALGAPWIFSADAPENPSLAFRIAALNRHLALIAKHQPDTPPSQIKNHAGRYFKGVVGGAEIRRQIFNQTSYADLVEIISSFSRGLL